MTLPKMVSFPFRICGWHAQMHWAWVVCGFLKPQHEVFNQEMLDTSSHSWGFYVLNLNLRMSQQLSSEWDELPGPFTSYFGVMAWRFQAETGFWMGPQKEREQVKKPGNYKNHLLQSTALILLETLFYLILLLTLYISGKHIFKKTDQLCFFLQGIDINWPCIGDDSPPAFAGPECHCALQLLGGRVGLRPAVIGATLGWWLQGAATEFDYNWLPSGKLT